MAADQKPKRATPAERATEFKAEQQRLKQAAATRREAEASRPKPKAKRSR